MGRAKRGESPLLRIYLVTNDALINFLAMNGHLRGCGKAKSHAIAIHFQQRDFDFIADTHALSRFPGQY